MWLSGRVPRVPPGRRFLALLAADFAFTAGGQLGGGLLSPGPGLRDAPRLDRAGERESQLGGGQRPGEGGPPPSFSGKPGVFFLFSLLRGKPKRKTEAIFGDPGLTLPPIHMEPDIERGGGVAWTIFLLKGLLPLWMFRKGSHKEIRFAILGGPLSWFHLPSHCFLFLHWSPST